MGISAIDVRESSDVRPWSLGLAILFMSALTYAALAVPAFVGLVASRRPRHL